MQNEPGAYRKDTLHLHINVVVSIIRCTQIKRALTECQDNPGLNFWRVIMGRMLDLAVLDWCQIFGTDGEPTHWKKVVPQGQYNEFRAGLLSKLGINEEEWTKYRQHLKDYRDQHVSHVVRPSKVPTYPSMDLALKACSYYYGYLIGEMRKPVKNDGLPDDLEVYSEAFLKQARRVAEKAMNATDGIEESVF
jgi:hypothetical protein